MLSFKEFKIYDELVNKKLQKVKKEGKPVAIVKGGKYDGQIIYTYLKRDKQGENKEDIPFDYETLLKYDFLKNLKKKDRLKKFKRITNILLSKRPTKRKIDELTQLAKETVDKNINREFTIDDGGMIELMPRMDSRECVHVAGPSESGKSTWIGAYGQKYKKLYPKNTIYVFTRVKEDPPIDALNPTRIEIDIDLVDDPIEPDELDSSLTIFDDTDTIRNKKIRNEIINLKNDILETGRHNTVYTLISTHNVTNYKETRCILLESNYTVVFPQGGGWGQIQYYLKRYLGMNKKQWTKIKKLDTHAVVIHKHYPQFVLYDHGIYLL